LKDEFTEKSPIAGATGKYVEVETHSYIPEKTQQAHEGAC